MDYSVLKCYRIPEDDINIIKKQTREELIEELKHKEYGGVAVEDLDDQDILECVLDENFTYLLEWEREDDCY